MRVSIAGSDAQESAIDILYEDEALLAVNKPAGIVTHPAYRHPDGTLWDAVLARQSQMGQGRPWLLHRLDRETSGVVIFAKTAEARRALRMSPPSSVRVRGWSWLRRKGDHRWSGTERCSRSSGWMHSSA